MLETYVQQINKHDKESGYKTVEQGAKEEDIVRIIKQAKDELAYELPGDYLMFLRVANGINYNGYFINCIDGTSFYPEGSSVAGKKMPGIVEETLWWRKDNTEFKNWVFFGSSDMDLYVYNGDADEFQQYDVSGDVWGRFSTFTEMAEKILRDALGIED